VFAVVARLLGSTLRSDRKRFVVAKHQAPYLEEAEALLLENEQLRKTAAELWLETTLLRETLRTHRKLAAPGAPNANRRTDCL
jgi:hypothetical protein